jgi:CelD/BcsL family acetyltransferase involved in cellulose biosynthesis
VSVSVHNQQALLNELYAERKALSREIGRRKAEGRRADDLVEQARAISARIKELTADGRAPGERAEAEPATWATAVATSAAGVTALQADWQDLGARGAAPSPFLTWEWMASWCETYEDAGLIQCLTVRDAAGRLVGIVPLFLSQRRDRKLSRRQLGFISTYGPSWGNYLELIHTPEALDAVVAATVEHLQKTRGEWRDLKLLRVPVEAQCAFPLIRALLRRDWQVVVRPAPPAAVHALPDEPEAVIASLASAKLRERLRGAQRRLAAEHPRHAFSTCPSRDELGAWLEPVMRLNADRRSMLSRPSNFLDAQYRECFLRSMQRFWEAGWLRVVRLEINGDVAAAMPFLIYRDTCYSLNPGWKPEYADYRVGHLIFVRAMELAVGEGARKFDLLPGYDAYKFQYASGQRQVMDICAWHGRPQMLRSLVGELAAAVAGRAVRLGKGG